MFNCQLRKWIAHSYGCECFILIGVSGSSLYVWAFHSYRCEEFTLLCVNRLSLSVWADLFYTVRVSGFVNLPILAFLRGLPPTVYFVRTSTYRLPAGKSAGIIAIRRAGLFSAITVARTASPVSGIKQAQGQTVSLWLTAGLWALRFFMCVNLFVFDCKFI